MSNDIYTYSDPRVYVDEVRIDVPYAKPKPRVIDACKGQHIGCPACMVWYLKHHANSCTYAITFPVGGVSVLNGTSMGTSQPLTYGKGKG